MILLHTKKGIRDVLNHNNRWALINSVPGMIVGIFSLIIGYYRSERIGLHFDGLRQQNGLILSRIEKLEQESNSRTWLSRLLDYLGVLNAFNSIKEMFSDRLRSQ